MYAFDRLRLSAYTDDFSPSHRVRKGEKERNNPHHEQTVHPSPVRHNLTQKNPHLETHLCTRRPGAVSPTRGTGVVLDRDSERLGQWGGKDVS